VSRSASFDPARSGDEWRFFATVGRAARSRAGFALTVLACGLGVFRELLRPASWHRPVRAELRRSLSQAVGGGLVTTIVAGGLVGIAMVYEALFWLGEVGEERLVGSILVSVLVREVAPVLVGLILLGRSGAATAEMSELHPGHQLDSLNRQGIDPFLLLVLPRAVAFAIASYTLGVVFVATALTVGFTAGRVGGNVVMSSWEFSSTVLGAMRPADFVIFPSKMLAIGMLVAITSVLTGLEGSGRDRASDRLPRTFTRGTLAIMVTSLVLSLTI